ncbi:MucB/RseB C-terminal domain-containing protein [Polaromonas sp.]
MNYVAAQVPPPVPAQASSGTAAEAKSINDWLMRMHEASKKQAYIGTYVVSSGGTISSAKIWHVCEGNQQMERVETLTGAPRSIFRHNDRVVTFMPDHKVVRSEKRESLGLFPELLQSTDSRIADFYKVKREGADRVAGVEADIVVLVPRDTMRFGYRVWTEQKSGMVVKLQTLDTDGKVLEQAAFSELQLDAPVKIDKLLQMMGKVDGYRVEKPVLVKTSASAEGWVLKAPVAGFTPMSCYKRPAAPSASQGGDEPLQWIFSDGLASVSLFLEPFDRQRHDKESSMSMGATQTMTRQLGAYWLTAMGEVPMATLKLFANGLERKK